MDEDSSAQSAPEDEGLTERLLAGLPGAVLAVGTDGHVSAAWGRGAFGWEGEALLDLAIEAEREGLETALAQARAGEGVGLCFSILGEDQRPWRVEARLWPLGEGVVGLALSPSHEEDALLAAVVSSTEDAILTFDPDGIITSWNAGAERFYGLGREEAVGSHVKRLLPEGRESEVRELMSRVLSGQRVKDAASVRRRADGSEMPALVSLCALRSEDGSVVGFASIDGDPAAVEAEEAMHLQLAEARAAQLVAEKLRERTEFMAESSAILYTSLDLDEVVGALASFLAPRIADWCAIDMADERSGVRLAALTPMYVSIASAEGSQARLDVALVGGRILRGEEATRLVPAKVGASEVLIVPICGHEGCLGAITLARRDGHPFSNDMLLLMEELSARAGAAIENVRLYTERLDIARTLERTLLLPELPSIPGLQVAALNLPVGQASEIGGDFYDIYEREPGSWGAVIGDAMGKGVEAATMTFAARHSLRTASLYEPSPAQALALVNESIFRYETPVVFCTMSYARLDLQGEDVGLTVANAGQPLPLLVSPAGEVSPLGQTGTALGAFKSVRLSDHHHSLAPGERAVFYTDGVLESAGSRSAFREEDLLALLRSCAQSSPQEIVARVQEAVLASCERPQDDIAILVIGRPAA
jgi:PAS domain S-box-containing protein